jgi:hypothetical protein
MAAFGLAKGDFRSIARPARAAASAIPNWSSATRAFGSVTRHVGQPRLNFIPFRTETGFTRQRYCPSRLRPVHLGDVPDQSKYAMYGLILKGAIAASCLRIPSGNGTRAAYQLLSPRRKRLTDFWELSLTDEQRLIGSLGPTTVVDGHPTRAVCCLHNGRSPGQAGGGQRLSTRACVGLAVGSGSKAPFPSVALARFHVGSCSRQDPPTTYYRRAFDLRFCAALTRAQAQSCPVLTCICSQNPETARPRSIVDILATVPRNLLHILLHNSQHRFFYSYYYTVH